MSTLILAVDHRNSLRGWLASLGVPEQEIEPTARRLKRLCVQALDQARDQLEPGENPMLLLDEEYGVDAIRDAKQIGLPIVIPAEQSGKAEFLFEHGDNFREAIDLLDPDAVKALVRYNVARRRGAQPPFTRAAPTASGPPARDQPPLHARAARAADPGAERRARRSLR